MVEVAVTNCRPKPYSKAWCVGLRYHHFRSLPAIFDIRQKLGRAGSSDVLQWYITTRNKYQGCINSYVNRGGSRNLGRGGGPSVPFRFLRLLFPLSVPSPSPLKWGPLNQLEGLGERCKLTQWGPGQSRGSKRIWCTLKLPESHWWL